MFSNIDINGVGVRSDGGGGGINFDGNEDIPVGRDERLGRSSAGPAGTFVKIDPGEALGQSVGRCSYVRLTDVGPEAYGGASMY